MTDKRVPLRQYNDRPRPAERCVCDDTPAWVIVTEFSDHTRIRTPYCGRTPIRDPTGRP